MSVTEAVCIRRPLRTPLVPALALSLIALSLLAAPSATNVPAGLQTGQRVGVPMHQAAFFDAPAFDAAVRRAAEEPAQPMTGVRAAVFPHHWLAGRLITGTLRDVAESGEFERVVLVGPDHVNAGSTSAATSDLAWQTPFGPVQPDESAVGALTKAGAASTEPGVLTYEHSISGIIPALAYYLPNARIVPISLRHGMREAEVLAMAELLASMMDEHTILLASVDFSHYLPAEIARARDRETIAAIESLDTATVLGFDNDHVDSPPSIAVLMETMRLVGTAAFELRDNTNSADMGAPPNEPVTSYVTGFFR